MLCAVDQQGDCVKEVRQRESGNRRGKWRRAARARQQSRPRPWPNMSAGDVAQRGWSTGLLPRRLWVQVPPSPLARPVVRAGDLGVNAADRRFRSLTRSCAQPLGAFLKGRIVMPKRILRPGKPAPRSGQYERVGRRGGRTGDEVTAVRGKPLPPTPQPGQGYVLVDPTKH